MNTIKLKKNALFNPEGDTDLRHRRMIGGNTTNLNDFNNMRYKWVSDWYRQAMNNFLDSRRNQSHPRYQGLSSPGPSRTHRL